MLDKKPNLMFEVTENLNERLDRYLTRRMPDYSRSRIQSLIRGGWIQVSGRSASSSELLKRGETIEIWFPPAPPETKGIIDHDLERRILFEDKEMIVLDKPAGLVVHPGAGHHGDSIVQRLSLKFSKGQWPDPIRPGVVHRLDRDTSGVLLLAKTPQALAVLSAQFADRRVEKIYHAITEGIFSSQSGDIESFLDRHPSMRTRFVVSGSGRWASTSFKVIEFLKGATYLEIHPLTGRSHQIRVHLAHIGHPVLGDMTYGASFSLFAKRQMLHAASLTIRHPRTEKRVSFKAPLPGDFRLALKSLRKTV